MEVHFRDVVNLVSYIANTTLLAEVPLKGIFRPGLPATCLVSSAKITDFLALRLSQVPQNLVQRFQGRSIKTGLVQADSATTTSIPSRHI